MTVLSLPDSDADVLAYQSIHDVLDQRAVVAVYQPLVDLTDGAVLGYEALARGPQGTQWERPDVLFDAARCAGRLAELDWVCRAAAYRGALAASLPAGVSLFVNTEPEALGSPCPPDLLGVMGEAERSLRVVCEMTERALTRDPAALLAAAERARRVGWGVAMDDVGVEPASLALMPFVHPDVIKLDMHLVQRPAAESASAISSAVLAQAERTGARVLAEGIETDLHRRRALALGATMGQGWLFGRPGPLPARVAAPADPVRLLRPEPLPHGVTPFDLVAGRPDVRTASKDLLLAVSKHLEQRALTDGEPPVVLATFQTREHLTVRAAERYSRLAQRSALVAALGVGIGPRAIGAVRGASVRDEDPLAHEWDVVVVGPHYAAALLARDLGDSGPDGDRRFSFVVTHDRALVLQAARALLLRVIAANAAAL